ncbi:MAG: DUF2723 domain-containing protein [Elusimicrobia bacterium]|nr:DUF2723 domain-containing protein [Elusimicrobiota bacterium]
MRERVLGFAAGALGVLFIYHASGTVAPFRDAGEFAVAASYLNIAHPPGYPLYVLMSKLWVTLIPFGNTAYRLNVLSALAAAGGFWLAAAWLRKFLGISLAAALIPIGLLISTRVFLGLSFVSEMYTLGFCWLVFLLYFIHQAQVEPRLIVLLAFCLPLALATRMDLVLALAYALPFLFFWFTRPHRRFLSVAALFFLLGGSVFLYLIIRSQSGAFVNWGDPSSWSRLADILARKSHGSTLDLLSVSYQKGQLFWVDARHWVGVLWETFGPLVLLIPLGIYALKDRPRVLAASLLSWILSGPVFLYLANMPPNPHAIKILEDHFMPSLLMAALWVAVGIDWLLKVKKVTQVTEVTKDKRILFQFLIFVTSVAFFTFVTFRVAKWSLRSNFMAYDYANNVLKSAAPNAVVVLHDDVQLFSLWEAQLNRRRRPDVKIVGQGLSGSSWYQKNLRETWGYRDLVLNLKLTNAPAWENFILTNPGLSLYAGYETQVDHAGIRRWPEGLLTRLCLPSDPLCGRFSLINPWPFLSLRHVGNVAEERFFFNQDLIEDYARARVEFGRELLGAGRADEGLGFLRQALNLKSQLPQAAMLLAYHYFSRADFAGSALWWRSSQRKFEELLRLTQEYRSLPDVVMPLKKDLAYVLTSLGVVMERSGDFLESAADLHRQAIEHDPQSVIAHYNLAAIYWKMRNLTGAKKEFEVVLGLDPGHAEAKKFLSLLR